MKDLAEVCDFISLNEVEYSWINKKTYGIYNPKTDKIKVNLVLMVAETLLHEFCHYKYPALGETEVEKMARAKVVSMRVKDIYELVEKTLKGGE